ncbi:MAG: hypothetical protein ACTTJS_02670 [Wolinella sp.]
MRETTFNQMLDFLLGASWAVVIIGGAFAFLFFSGFGFIIAAMALFLASLLGMTLVVFFEFIRHSMRYRREQSELLGEMCRMLKSNSAVDRNNPSIEAISP